MKKANIITVGTAIALLLCAMAGYAAKKELPYKITIGLSKRQYGGPSPTFDISIRNISKNITAFYLFGPTHDYAADVRHRTTDAHKSSWLQIKPKIARTIIRSIIQTPPGPHYSIKFYIKEVIIPSGQTREEVLYFDNYDTSAMGDYQVTLSMDLPDCTLESPKADSFSETIEAKAITINSNTIYLRHTATGFSDVTEQYKGKKKS